MLEMPELRGICQGELTGGDKCVASARLERKSDLIESLELALLGFSLALVQYFFTVLLSSLLEWQCISCATVCCKYVMYFLIGVNL